MATTSIWSVKGWLGKLVIYVENPNKTTNPQYYEKAELTEKQAQTLLDVIDYAADPSKTDSAIHDENIETHQQFVTGINCLPATARDEMQAVKRRFGKEDGVITSGRWMATESCVCPLWQPWHKKKAAKHPSV